MHTLLHRRQRVSKLRDLALKDRNAHKALQAKYIIQELNKRIFNQSQLKN